MTAELIGQLAFVVFALIALGWIYWLVARVQLILDRAEQAVDSADRLLGVATWQPEPDGEWAAEHEQRQVPQLVDLGDATGPIPVVRTDTVDMHQAWDTSAADLADGSLVVSKSVGGQTFRFREEASETGVRQ